MLTFVWYLLMRVEFCRSFRLAWDTAAIGEVR